METPNKRLETHALRPITVLLVMRYASRRVVTLRLFLRDFLKSCLNSISSKPEISFFFSVYNDWLKLYEIYDCVISF